MCWVARAENGAAQNARMCALGKGLDRACFAGESLNEYVVRHAVEAAETDLADRRVFAIDDAAWSEFEALLSRPPTRKPRLSKLLSNPSVLDQPES